ncbi:hypothetical protein CFOLD11_40810 [Clostridium folliculivorans]|uniref:Uncharacterized protein n=1 Tax=Clostridium folliculivorans TaxID=2886038 RepID=A0A9W6DCF3_9CLOT|nr:hypothetical protein [Clostridium folliculivorans]GKU27254.1 hypothetical protein CFOLD11_40810 [Clostridium folliculivorans]
MASSSYYYSKYKEKKNEVDDYEDNLKDLHRILDNLNYDLGDEISYVNNELDALVNNLNDAVRHNSSFTTKANDFVMKKAKSVDADSQLGASKYALEEEISRINNLRNQAISDRDYYYKKYVEKKAEERAAAEKAAAAH